MKNYKTNNLFKVFLNADEEKIEDLNIELDYYNIQSAESENKILNIIESAKAEIEFQKSKNKIENFEKVY